MRIDNFALISTTENALLTLARKVQLLEGLSFRTNKSATVKRLLEHCRNSDKSEIQHEYFEFCSSADESFVRLAHSWGISLKTKDELVAERAKKLNQDRAYRGTSSIKKHTTNKKETNKEGDDKSYTKKVVYRGKEQSTPETSESRRVLSSTNKSKDTKKGRFYRGQYIE